MDDPSVTLTIHLLRDMKVSKEVGRWGQIEMEDALVFLELQATGAIQLIDIIHTRLLRIS